MLWDGKRILQGHHCFVLGITKINPLDYDLLFERF
ncbi:MAG: hypothetical protein IPG53_19950 [Ignavibacteriales bacterium]|nr:hypothetical protein [Ignavibacteriales bacterium]